MYTVLLVDDEALSLKAIRRMVDWQALGADRVLEASNGRDAQHILKNNRVNLMICDIEMPRMDGLALVEWLRGEQMDTEVIILTCHDSFDMAQKALHLGSVEYILKPVSPGALTESAGRALQVWKEKADYRGASRLWDESISFRRVHYFSDIIQKDISSTPNSLINHGKLYGLSFDENDKIHMALVCVENTGEPQGDMQDFMYGLQNVALELWNDVMSDWGCLIRRKDTDFLLLGSGGGQEGYEENFCGRFQEFAAKHHMGANIYMGEPCGIRNLCSQAERLALLHERSQFLGLSALKPPVQEGERIWRSTESRWGRYAENGNFNLIQEEIVDAVKSLSGTASQRREHLERMKQALLAAMKAGGQGRTDGTDNSLGEDGAMESETGSSYNEAQFLMWSEWLLQRMEKRRGGKERYGDVVDRICKYIAMNIHREITREDIAAAVYLNPDYVARLFKKETGMTLNAYLIRKRIALARQLLAYTEIPVGDISGNLGYSSFSHFTKIFRGSEGMTPSEYRRLHRKGG